MDVVVRQFAPADAAALADVMWRTLVACVDDRVVGYVDLEDNGHIDHLYCAPEAVGRGVASRLYDAVEQLALASGIERLYVEASGSCVA